MNVRDSEVIRGLLITNNHKLTTNPDEADILIYNTCSVRQHAEDKVWSEIGRFKKSKINPSTTLRIDGECSRIIKNQKSKIIGLVGCMGQNYKQKIFDRAPQVDFVIGPSDMHKIPEIINKVTGRRLQVAGKNLLESKIWETDGYIRPEEIYHTGFYEDKHHAYVVISEGCSNYCSYCIVPYVRGELHNRNYQGILKEIEQAVGKGITKFTLLGQNVNSYMSQATCHKPHETCGLKPETISFIKLLDMVNKIKGITEFSFITSHPKDTTIELFKAMEDCSKLKKYLHLPVQSGSDRILKLMNRAYSRNFYLDLVNNYRKIVKNSTLTTDIIVGFPGETESEFQDTLSLVEDVKFNAAYIFKYSTRMNTQAAKLDDDVPLKEKERRHRIMLELQKEISRKS